jgi:hypothetical protein
MHVAVQRAWWVLVVMNTSLCLSKSSAMLVVEIEMNSLPQSKRGERMEIPLPISNKGMFDVKANKIASLIHRYVYVKLFPRLLATAQVASWKLLLVCITPDWNVSSAGLKSWLLTER